jgi:hypothetical protein
LEYSPVNQAKVVEGIRPKVIGQVSRSIGQRCLDPRTFLRKAGVIDNPEAGPREPEPQSAVPLAWRNPIQRLAETDAGNFSSSFSGVEDRQRYPRQKRHARLPDSKSPSSSRLAVPNDGVPVFHEARAPSVAELAKLEALLSRIIKRILTLLTRPGFLIGEMV